MTTEQTIKPQQADGVPAGGRDVLSVTDERTGRQYELAIEESERAGQTPLAADGATAVPAAAVPAAVRAAPACAARRRTAGAGGRRSRGLLGGQ